MRRYVPLARKVNLNAMLPGGAPVAVRLFADIRLYRADGVEAFSTSPPRRPSSATTCWSRPRSSWAWSWSPRACSPHCGARPGSRPRAAESQGEGGTPDGCRLLPRGLKVVERQERVFHDYPEGTVIVKEIYPGLAVNRARPGQEIGDDQRLRAVLRLPLQRQRAAPVRRQEPVERVP